MAIWGAPPIPADAVTDVLRRDASNYEVWLAFKVHSPADPRFCKMYVQDWRGTGLS